MVRFLHAIFRHENFWYRENSFIKAFKNFLFFLQLDLKYFRVNIRSNKFAIFNAQKTCVGFYIYFSQEWLHSHNFDIPKLFCKKRKIMFLKLIRITVDSMCHKQHITYYWRQFIILSYIMLAHLTVGNTLKSFCCNCHMNAN